VRQAVSEHDTESQSEHSGSIFGLIWRWRAILGAGVIVTAAIFAGRVAWEEQREGVVRDAASLLTADRIELIGVPPWITTDLKWQALRNASLDMPLPLDAPDLERQLARAFDMHPWVRRVERVETSHPAAAVVRVICREPVAMVRVEGGLLAVDRETILLPSDDFTAESAAKYPVVDGVSTSPRGPVGSPWGDPTVDEAVNLITTLAPEANRFGLIECRRVPREGTAGNWWELVGSDELVVLFGSAPGGSVAGEPSAARKIVRLGDLAELHARGERVDDIDLTKAR
jgi:hypothetical protein|tara:strand:+ start:66 stop:923 length:858 start_codon:yes stop_codon:yes gene_type:complete